MGEDKSKRARVFVSYSRKDLAFADQLDVALRTRGFEPLIDRAEVYAFEDWWQRIETLIGNADAVIFVLSPEAVASDVCRQEVAFAMTLNKRLAPVVWRRVNDHTVPEHLRRLNFIFFDDADVFDARMDLLSQALSTDIAWVRKHTEFGEQARRWHVAGRPGPRGLLLRSPALEEAEQWIASRPSGAPLPTEATQAFVAESRRETTRRRNTLSASLGAGLLIALALAGAAVWQWRGAQIQRNDALIAQSRFLARDARGATAEGNATLGMLLALAALPKNLDEPERPFVQEAEDALAEAYSVRRERLVIDHHREPVNSVNFSPDGGRLLTASDDGTAVIWDVGTGSKIVELRGHQEWVLFGAFSTDSKRVVTGSADKTARIWDAASGVEIAVLRGHENIVLAADFSPDGARVVTASGDGTARLWDAKTGLPVAVLSGHRGQVLAAVFSPDGSRIVTAAKDTAVRVWDSATGAQLATRSEHTNDVMSVAFSASGARFVTASQDRTARVWDANDATVLAVLRGHEEEVSKAVFSPDGKFVATASRDGTARVWESDTGTLFAFYRHGGEVSFVGFAGDSTRLVMTSHDGKASLGSIWPQGGGSWIDVIRGHTAGVVFAAAAPNGMQFATVSSDRTVRVWNVETVASERVFRARAGMILDASLSRDGKRLATGGGARDDTSIQLWDAVTGDSLAVLAGHEGWTSDVVFSADGTRLLTSGQNHTAKLWDTKTFTLIGELPGKEQVRQVAFSPDGKHALTVDNTMRLWDAHSGALVAEMEADDVRWAEYSADSTRIITAHDDATARIWNADSGKEVAVLAGHEGEVWYAGLSADGSRVVTTSRDKTARVWDAKNGMAIAVLRGHEDTVSSAAFSADGTRILTAGSDKTARVWDAATGRELIILPHPTRVQKSAFSPDGRLVLLGGGSARLWDLRTRAEINLFKGGGDHVSSGSFSSDGARIVTPSGDGTARFWMLPPRCQRLINRAHVEVPRALTSDERARYFLTGHSTATSRWPESLLRPLLMFAVPSTSAC